MPVYLQPYRPDLINRLRNIAESHLKENIQAKSDSGVEQQTSSSKSSVPDFDFTIEVDLLPLCRKSTDLSLFDQLEELISAHTQEISITLHFNRIKHADKYILRMNGVDRAIQVKSEKDLSGLTSTVDVERIRAEAEEQARKTFLAEQQAQENEKLRLEIERMKSEPPSEDSIQLNKLIMTAGMAAIKKWETGSLFGNEKAAPASNSEPSGQQKHLLTIGKWFCKRFPQEQHFNAMIELVNLLSRHPELIAIMHDLAAEAQHKSSDAQNEEQEEDDAEEDNQDDQDVIDLTDQTPSNI
jgi:hypothetical protein